MGRPGCGAVVGGAFFGGEMGGMVRRCWEGVAWGSRGVGRGVEGLAGFGVRTRARGWGAGEGMEKTLSPYIGVKVLIFSGSCGAA